MSAARILVVDDESEIRGLLKEILADEGYEVDVAADATEARAIRTQHDPDLVLLDIWMPDTDGITLLKQLRDTEQAAPTLFLTARDSVDDRIVGLTAGGDDYMTKPFSLEELVARLRGLLRRTITTSSDEDSRIQVGDLLLDESSYEVNRGGTSIALTTTEFELLRYLMLNPNRVLSKAQILDHVWEYDFRGESGIVESYISYLRRKIDTEGHPPLIHTKRGVGYVLRLPPQT